MAQRKFTRKHLPETTRLILDAISGHIAREGYPPSVREICDATGIRSTSTVHSHLKRMEQSGQLVRPTGQRRAMRVPGSGPVPDEAVASLPLYGVVRAGSPIFAEQNLESLLPYPSSLLSGIDPSQAFLLRVRGDSMRDAAILDGDLIVVQRQEQAEPGQIVVALQEDEATVKTFVRVRGKPFLRPENAAYDPIPVTPETRILGRVIGVMRSY